MKKDIQLSTEQLDNPSPSKPVLKSHKYYIFCSVLGVICLIIGFYLLFHNTSVGLGFLELIIGGWCIFVGASGLSRLAAANDPNQSDRSRESEVTTRKKAELADKEKLVEAMRNTLEMLASANKI